MDASKIVGHAHAIKACGPLNSILSLILQLIRTVAGVGIRKNQKCMNMSGNIFWHDRKMVSRIEFGRVFVVLGTAFAKQVTFEHGTPLH